METFLFYLEYVATPIMFFGILVVSFLLVSLRLYNQWIFRRNKKYRTIIQQFLIEIAINDYNKTQLKSKLKLFRHSIPFYQNWCKVIVINEMIRLKKNIKGDKTTIISLLYKSLNLHKYSSKLIQDFRPYKKCIGFYHFQLMKYYKGRHQISPYLKSRNDLIRSNANVSFIALIDLSKEELPHIPERISNLNQIKIMDIFHEQKKEYPNRLDFLLKADKSSLIELGLKIMTYFNNRNESKRVIELLNFPVESVRTEALFTISKLYLKEAEKPILEKITLYSQKAQIDCFWCLAEIGSQHTTSFITSNFENYTSTDVQLASLYCLQKIDPLLANDLVSKNQNYSKMLKHVKTLWM